MSTILYPTRGGDSTYLNQDWVFELARGKDASLLLLYVSNVSFLDLLAGPARLDLMEAELDELGEFLLAMAQERAETAGVTAGLVVRRGSFRDALQEVVLEHQVNIVILGYPSQETALTTHEYINSLAQFLQDECAVEVYVIDEGEIIEHYLPPAIDN
ncbi:MAG: hypothetical protein BMS9Abin02_1921 [Anaerolineae bacterium]|nr:MAG: hypothetical protein BMS9Abin02_1921 [Anaerolineae bacterium]